MTVIIQNPTQLAVAVQNACEQGFHLPVLHTAVDYQSEIELVYCLRNPQEPQATDYWIRVRVDGENPRIPSMTPLVPGLEFQEREVFDLFGVIYEGHPDLRRLLLPDHFDGHPLRKSYTQNDGHIFPDREVSLHES